MSYIKHFKFVSKKQTWSILLTLLLNLTVILFIYQSVFTLEFQGDGWQYAWGHHVYYESNVFGKLSLEGMRSSLGGASLTFGLIENHFGLNAAVFYTISVALKLLSVLTFYFLVKKLTGNFLASTLATLILSSTAAGIEATHWVFNMYAYIGLIFILISIITAIDLPKEFTFKKWLVSFLFACAGIWYATMRTNGIIPLILFWSVYKAITVRSKSSIKNLIFWFVGLSIFILIDKFLLGQMESDYSSKYIIGAGLQAFQSQIAVNKYDFFLSPATNLGLIILPDITWLSSNFPKIFSFLGGTLFRSAILPSFIIFSTVTWILSPLFIKGGKTIFSKFLPIFLLEVFWTLTVLFILKIGPFNFSSWEKLVPTLFGGYFMILCLYPFLIKETQTRLKDLFFFSFFWFFLFFLLPLFQNGGNIIGTISRYMVTTAPSIALFVGGLLTLSFNHKNKLARILLLSLVCLMIFAHGTRAKSFFDLKALVHNREVSDKIWRQFLVIIPNKAEYRDDPPALFFVSANNLLDQETLFESLYFGVGFRLSIEHNWRPDHFSYVYNQGDYPNLVKDVKKNPKILDNFYAVIIQDQNLFDITPKVKQKILSDIQS